MRPVRTASTTNVAPATFRDGIEVFDTPTAVADGATTVVFSLTREERRQIGAGANIAIRTWAQGAAEVFVTDEQGILDDDPALRDRLDLLQR